MKVTNEEQMFFLEFLNQGIDQNSLIHFIKNVRNCPMYGSIFHINGIDKKLKKLLSDIYHYRVDFLINNKPVRGFISKTWNL